MPNTFRSYAEESLPDSCLRVARYRGKQEAGSDAPKNRPGKSSKGKEAAAKIANGTTAAGAGHGTAELKVIADSLRSIIRLAGVVLMDAAAIEDTLTYI